MPSLPLRRGRSGGGRCRRRCQDAVRLTDTIVLQFYEGDDQLRARQLLDEFLKNATFRKIVAITAAEPQLGLAKAGPNLLFAEAWVAYAAVAILMRKGQVKLEEITDTITFSCCHTLAEWSKTGYRLDWHPLDAATKGPDSSAPVGRWTQEQANEAAVSDGSSRPKVAPVPTPPPAPPAPTVKTEVTSKRPGVWARLFGAKGE